MDDSIRFLSGLVLAAGALAALVRCRRPGLFLVPLLSYAALLACLAMDKLLRFVDHVHEGLHARGIGDPPFLNGIDDLIYLGLGAMVVAGVWHWRRLVFASRGVTRCVVASGVLFAATFSIDALGPAGGWLTMVEQVIELVGAVFLVAPAIAPFWRWRRRPLGFAREWNASYRPRL